MDNGDNRTPNLMRVKNQFLLYKSYCPEKIYFMLSD